MALTKVTRNLLSTGIDDQSTSTAITIDSSGYVGIGTSSPGSILDIRQDNTGGQASIRLYNTDNSNTTTQTSAVLISPDSRGTTGVGFAAIKENADYSTTAGRDASMAFYTLLNNSATEAMRIDSSGNVCIGNTIAATIDPANASANLVVGTGSGSEGITIYSGTTSLGNLCFADGTTSTNTYSGYITYNHSSNHMEFGTNGGSERMRIDSSGNLRVGISNSVPANNTEAGFLAGPSGASGGYGSAFIQIPNNASNGYGMLGFYAGSTLLGNITKTGSNSCAYNTSSDYRLKENVVEMDGAIDRVKLLQPKRFNFIAAPEDTVDGFIAHEVSDIVPEAITGVKDEMQEEEYEVTPAVLDEDGNVVTEAVMGTREVPKYQGIDQSKLVPLLTGALQEAITKIEQLEARITTLENA